MRCLTRLIVAVLLSAIVCGCGSLRLLEIPVEHRQPLTEPPAEALLAGFARVDITPPPGISMGGYSAMAGTGNGFRGRLHARVVYLASPEGDSLALVQSDLLSGSRLLHHRLAELIAETTDVPARGLMLAGTHTHSAPGNYFGSNFYNKFASAQKGLDIDLYDFLASRIAAAIQEAYENRRPARIAGGSKTVYGVTRNRSMEPYLANEDVDAAVYPAEAVHPRLFMIRFDLLDDSGDYKPAGAFSVYSIHPTVIPYWNDLYNPDVFGYITAELEHVRNAAGDFPRPFVHAAVNGSHGDNSPDYEHETRGFMEARRLGRTLGEKTVQLFDELGKDLQDNVAVRTACREVNLYEHPEIDGVSLCSRPVVGNALTAGAEDGQTPVLRWMPFFREGWATSRWFFTGSCQGHKRHVGGIFQRLVLPGEDFPHHLFFQTIRVGEAVLLPLPFEVTCQAGQRIEQAVAADAYSEEVQPVVISCANGYFGYAVTPEEYSRQHYEGGHTLYGPDTSPFLARHLVSLAAAMERGEKDNLPDEWLFRLKGRPGFPADRQASGGRFEATAPLFSAAENGDEANWRFRWRDLPPARINFHQPLVYVETSVDGVSWQALERDGRPVDDRSLDMAVRFCRKIDKNGMGLYEALWFNPRLPEGHVCRFAVLPRGEEEIFYSSVFPGEP